MPTHLLPTPTELPTFPDGRTMRPARNWWPVTPGYRGRLRADDGEPVTRGPVRKMVRRLNRQNADLRERLGLLEDRLIEALAGKAVAS